MTFAEAAISFVVYSVLGWSLDAAYRSYHAGRFTRGGFTRYPFSPIYGLGALLIVSLHPFISPLPIWAEGLVYAVLLTAYEYMGGVYCVLVFKRRFWNYSRSRWNLHGHTALENAAIWAVLALLLVYGIHPILLLLVR